MEKLTKENLTTNEKEILKVIREIPIEERKMILGFTQGLKAGIQIITAAAQQPGKTA